MKPSDWVVHKLAGGIHNRRYRPGYELHIDPIPADQVEKSGILSGAWIIRVPPIANDREMYADPLAKRLGTSGWNVALGHSEHVGFDFDVRSDAHKGRRAISPADLMTVENAARSLPYVEIISSKSGAGRHLWVEIDGEIVAKSRDEHKLAAAAVLAQMCKDASFPFNEFADVYGGIMWLWHRSIGPGGFQLLKPATAKLALPHNWREVGELQAKKMTAQKLGSVGYRKLRNLISESDAEMDDEHRTIQDWCVAHGWPFHLQDWNGKTVIHVHTAGLRAYASENPVKGFFDTASNGSDASEPNAFAFLAPDGGLVVRRFGNAAECKSWVEHGDWAIAKFNIMPTYDEACRAAKGKLNSQGCYVFDHENEAIALRFLGIEFEMPDALKGHQVKFKRDGSQLFLIVREQEDDPKRIPGWTLYRREWQFTIGDDLPTEKLDTLNHLIRHTVSETRGGEEWLICDVDGRWQKESLAIVEKVIKGEGIVDVISTSSIVAFHARHNWTLTNSPFADEYPAGTRIWNRDGAKYAFDPRPGIHPHWDKILRHCGSELDPEVAQDEWCQANGLTHGADYLRMWCAILMRQPRQHLPMLFFHGEDQDSGKSSFHRSLTLLFRDGVGATEIKKELTRDDFNDPFEGCVLGYIEEINISTSFAIYDAIKNMVDADRLKLRGMYSKGRMIPNYMHLVQCANSLDYSNIPPGDTRIVAIHVGSLEHKIPWESEFRRFLLDEGPAFLDSLLRLQLPQGAAGRLFLPVLATESKREAMCNFEAKYRGWYYTLVELALKDGIVNKSADELLSLLRDKSSDESLKSLNPAALGKKLIGLRSKFESDGLEYEYRPPQGRTKPAFSIRPALRLAA